ncbi:MAG: bifunctional phosphoglucose/phosphomannose isomerase [candidate division Zixibacteria bacterium RBG_16_40_9]|nr:MAG: bifunctional phosphoglucose/phosphomannose isomerase [candidate division Zixibacteria bacterium RBG_16_40_9]
MLDQIKKIEKLDQKHMHQLLVSFPSQLDRSITLTHSFPLPNWKNFKFGNLVLAGMGGSAIGGDLVRSYLSYQLKIPFQICRHYLLPNFVTKNSSVLVSSYSGNTEETLSAYALARKRKAKIIAITSGGKLFQLAKKDKVPVLLIPGGLPPRAALGYSFGPWLILLSRLGLIKNQTALLKETVSFLAKQMVKYEKSTTTSKNQAKRLAERLYQKIPIIYSGCDCFDAVATRWKQQICENAKNLAFVNFFPEFNHNELVGWQNKENSKHEFVVLFLKDKDDHKRVKARMEIVKGIIKKQKIEVIEIESQGKSLLSRMFYLIQLGDWTSFYLAMLNGVDPTPIKVIDYLKYQLERI